MKGSTARPGDSERAYAHLEGVLRRIGARAALVLGSVGKGERPLLVNGPLAELSDIEVASIGIMPWRKNEVTKASLFLSGQFGQTVRIYIAHPSWSTVRRFFSTMTAQVVFPTLKEYDRWFGSRLIFGREFRDLDHMQPDRRPPSWEGMTLVLNHSIGVLRAMLLTHDSRNRIQSFQEYACAKVLLACTVFLELRLGAYHIDPRQRIEFLGSQAASWARDLAIDEGRAMRAFERALSAKSNPGENSDEQGGGTDVTKDTCTILDRVLRLSLGVAQPPEELPLRELATAYLRQEAVAPRNQCDALISKSIDLYRVKGLLRRGKGLDMLRLAMEHRVAVRHLVYSQVGPLVLARLQNVTNGELSALAEVAEGLYAHQRIASTSELWPYMASRIVGLWSGFCE